MNLTKFRIILINILVITAVLFSGTAYAQDEELPDSGITPDSPFYFLDNWGKSVGMFFTFGPEAKARKALEYAEERLAETLVMAAENRVKEMTQAAINEGVAVKEILNKGLIAGMAVVGARFKKNECYVPEVLIAARAMNAGMEILQPLLAESGVEPIGKIAIGTVKGDLHDIGKNLVLMMLKGAGFEIDDLGIDVPPEKFISAIKDGGAKVVAMSALLTTTMPGMKDTIEAFEKAGLAGQAKVMIGGAPVTQSYADEIKADGYAPDASSAVDKAKELLGLS